MGNIFRDKITTMPEFDWHFYYMYNTIIDKLKLKGELTDNDSDYERVQKIIRSMDFGNGWVHISYDVFEKKDVNHGTIFIYATYNNKIKDDVNFFWAWESRAGSLIAGPSKNYVSPDDCVKDIIDFWNKLIPHLDDIIRHHSDSQQTITKAWEKYGWC